MEKKKVNYQLLIRRVCLIILDILCIIAASFLALLTRFEFDFHQIPPEFLKVIYEYGPFIIVVTLIIFTFFVSAKYSCGFSIFLVSSIIVGERYLDYFTTITEDRL